MGAPCPRTCHTVTDRVAAVGGLGTGVVLEPDPGTGDWRDVTPETTQQMIGVWLTRSGGWSVGVYGEVLRRRNDAWEHVDTDLSLAESLHAVCVDRRWRRVGRGRQRPELSPGSGHSPVPGGRGGSRMATLRTIAPAAGLLLLAAACGPDPDACPDEEGIACRSVGTGELGLNGDVEYDAAALSARSGLPLLPVDRSVVDTIVYQFSDARFQLEQPLDRLGIHVPPAARRAAPPWSRSRRPWRSRTTPAASPSSCDSPRGC